MHDIEKNQRFSFSSSLLSHFNLLSLSTVITSIFSYGAIAPVLTLYQYASTIPYVPHHLSLHICGCHHQFANLLLSGSPNVTNLVYDNQSRTLTSTSTGGPATTVTWRKDGTVITLNATYQQTKRVVDLVEGTYQTVLTIGSSVSQSDIVGTYECTVENARGESSETVVVPGETIVGYVFI